MVNLLEDTFKGVFTRENINEASESEDRPRQSELRMVNFTTRTIEQKKADLSKAARPDRIGPRLPKELASRPPCAIGSGYIQQVNGRQRDQGGLKRSQRDACLQE
jgi:hypothetical protein